MPHRFILNAINTCPTNAITPLPRYPGVFAIDCEGVKGIGIEVPTNITIQESFNNLMLSTESFPGDPLNRRFVFLHHKKTTFGLTQHYGLLCYDFIQRAALIQTNPQEWYNELVEELGNSFKKKTVYDIVGEMKVLLHLQRLNQNPNWESVTKGTYDITAGVDMYEVKTSKSKSSRDVEINSALQLDTTNLQANLYLARCQVEEMNYGDSIDSLYNDLIAAGYSSIQLDDYLDDCGFYKGSQDRNKKFIVHELTLYLVDANFPRITASSFVNGKIPDGIHGLTYKVDLNVVKPFQKII